MRRAVFICVGIAAMVGGLFFLSGARRDVVIEALRRTFGIGGRTPDFEITLNNPALLLTPEKPKKKNTARVSSAVAPQKPVVLAPVSTSSNTTTIAVIPIKKQEAHSAPDVPVPQCDFTASNLPNHYVLLNEIAWMGTAESASREWIELRNNAGQDISLVGWQILNEDGDMRILFEQDEKIPAGGLFLMERTTDDAVPAISADKIYSGSFSNDGEWLRLFDAGCMIVDELDASGGWKNFGGENTTKKTLERNVTSFDWHTSGATGGTPKVQNSNLAPPLPAIAAVQPTLPAGATPSSTSPAPSSSIVVASGHVIISEIFYDAAGSDTGKEFIELYNDSGADLDLKDWSLQSNGSSLGKIGLKSEDKTMIRAGGYFLVGLNSYAGTPSADAVRAASLPNTAATIALVDPGGTIVDVVSYNASVAEGEGFERESWASSQFRVQASPTPVNSGL